MVEGRRTWRGTPQNSFLRSSYTAISSFTTITIKSKIFHTLSPHHTTPVAQTNTNHSIQPTFLKFPNPNFPNFLKFPTKTKASSIISILENMWSGGGGGGGGGGVGGGDIYWGRKEKSESRGIAVIFAWASIQDRHLRTYVDLYASLRWNSLVCHADFLNAYVPSFS